MKKRIRVAASMLACDFSCLRKEVEKCEEAGVDYIHIDVMDGHFVPNITIGPVIIESIRPHTKLPIDAHLMIENPRFYIKDYISAGSDIVTLHVESYGEYRSECKMPGSFPKNAYDIKEGLLLKDISNIRTLGAKPSITFNPATPLCCRRAIEESDKVLIMSVNPGFAGQKFMKEVLPKIKELRGFFRGDIEVDGGMNNETAPLVIEAGADIIVTASYFFKSKNPKKAIENLRR